VFPRVFSYISKGRDILSVLPALDAPADVLEIIGDVIKTFGGYSASALSAWTHIKGSPWDKVVNDMDTPNGIIPDDLIAEYFSANVLREAENA
jgi:uncharacterized phage-associated protein